MQYRIAYAAPFCPAKYALNEETTMLARKRHLFWRVVLQTVLLGLGLSGLLGDN
jgi:hypothetical protein